MERRDSSIKSQISDMIYNASLDDLDQTDNGVPSELYRVNVFGKNITIAPGKPKKNPKYPGIVYFYIYVIKGGTAIAKLGVYEKKTTETLEMYDLTAFPEGSLMLFDLYYNEPARINVFEEEVRQYVNKESKEIFNYLAKYIPVNNANVGILKQQIGKLKQLKMKSGLKYPKTKNNDVRTRIMEVFDIFGQEPVMDQSLLKKLSDQVKPDMRMFALFILEYLLSVRFIFINNDTSLLNEDEMREIKVAGNSEPIKKYIVVSLEDSPVFIADHDYLPGEDIPTRVEEIKQEHVTEKIEEEDLELELDELPPENNEAFNQEVETIKEEEKEKQNVVNQKNNSINSTNSSIYVPPSGLEQIDVLPLQEGLSVNSEASRSNSNNSAKSNSSNSGNNSANKLPANFNNTGNANKKANNGSSNTSANATANETANATANATANGSSNTSANATAISTAPTNNSANALANKPANATNNSANTTANKPANATNNSSNANNSGSEESTQESVVGGKIKRTQRHIKIKS